MKPNKNNQAIFIRKIMNPDVSDYMNFTGQINEKQWFGWPMGTWLLLTQNWERKDTKTGIWKVELMFYYRASGWNPRIIEEGRIVEYNVYAIVDFGILGLTEEDWIPE